MALIIGLIFLFVAAMAYAAYRNGMSMADYIRWVLR